MKNRMIAWVAGVVSIVVILMVVIVAIEPPKDGITRAQAFKALALALTSKEECERKEGERGSSYFSAKEKDNWFVKYMDYLYESQYLDEELSIPTLASAQGFLTYGEVSYLAGKVSGKLKSQVGATKYNRDSIYPQEDWWQLYDGILKVTDPEGLVRTIDGVLYGTPSNLPQAGSWTAYTTEGNFGFQGLALDSYLDCEIRFLAREGEMIAMRELVSENVVYENVWLAEGQKGYFKAYLGTSYREFPVNADMENSPDMVNLLADLHMEKGRLTKITMKKDRISGKVLSVTDKAIEIEGYGEIPLAENFHVYKAYGDFKVMTAKDILVGYDLQEFVTAEGHLCAALLEREFDAKTIRVLLMDTGFKSAFHPEADLVLSSPAVMEYENSKGKTEREGLEAGTELLITPEDNRLKYGRITITPDHEDGITVRSIERSNGNPSYSGRLEIKAEEKGLALVNDLYLEEYLTKVVPSEMPASYEMEALKAQAVCARTYAYRQIQGNSYSQYGAHVDDSINFQVYNNADTNERTDQAVKETYGKMLICEGKPIDAFYYSTSCGHGADGSVWGAGGEALPYLQAVEIKSGGKILDEDDNENFDAFIKGDDPAAYESAYSMFRWETDISRSMVTAQINGVGTVQDLVITGRGPGGIASVLKVAGTDGTINIEGQSAIRSALGNRDLVITKKDGKTLENNPTLPSAFISVEKRVSGEGEVSFHIYGGGYGHGVGMSQNGAQSMAKNGMDYGSILSFFYRGTELMEVSGEGVPEANG
ncbi:MAG: SpoIID/LytB domain-containing protein [Clostridium sp.]|nr:SpoIID/LytB domain-containing protein [Clostridium sp.]